MLERLIAVNSSQGQDSAKNHDRGSAVFRDMLEANPRLRDRMLVLLFLVKYYVFTNAICFTDRKNARY